MTGTEAPMDRSPVRVLLVDENRNDYLLTRELFAAMGGRQYALEWTADYDAALAAIRRGDHDVYLLEYRLGGRSGFELLREAADNRCKGPVIVLTGQGEQGLAMAAMRAGAADYLDKGRLDASLLERSIRYALQHRRNQEELERRVSARTAELEALNAELENRVAAITADLQRASAEREPPQDPLLQAQKMQSIGTLVSGVAHDFNNLLNLISGYAAILRVDKSPARIAQAAGIIEESVQRATLLVRQLMTLEGKAGASIETAPADGAPITPGHGETILFVDDEELQLDLMQSFLERKGYKVIGARDGVAALEIFKQQPEKIALAVLDLGLPGLDGWQAFQQMREIRPDLKALIVSGFVSEEIEAAVKKGELGSVVTKPYQLDVVLEKISEVIRR